LKDRPDLVRKFLKATGKGYRYSIDNPEDAANILIKHAPEIDRDIAVASQKYLAGEYMKGVSRWGEMKLETWERYGNWMYENGLLERKLDAQGAFTNEFLSD